MKGEIKRQVMVIIKIFHAKVNSETRKSDYLRSPIIDERIREH